jgi:hypothetical protein
LATSDEIDVHYCSQVGPAAYLGGIVNEQPLSLRLEQSLPHAGELVA